MVTRIVYVENGYQQCLPLISSTVKSHVVDLTASHTLTQVYHNSSTKAIAESQYTFPLYESSAVTDFQALVGEKTIKGVVQEKAKAEAIYQAAKSAGKVTALFTQDTGEVFTTSVGNIPAGGSVVVVIKYVHELKQDIDVDGVRLVIPTVIAPKYGNAPATTDLVLSNRWRTCWGNFSRDIRDIGCAEDAGLSLSVTATMSGTIRGITSPSHPISIGLGSHSSADDADFNPRKAHATLALASPSLTGLDKDFSLLINANNAGDPRAFLAPHPTLQDTSALMVTMVPKFVLPPQAHEIIFVVDRSGSMHDKIATVRSALQLFLASLPVGSYFNICSFGSNHSFLWPQSQKYSGESLNAAKAHARGLDSNMGGTEILAPVMDTMKKRRPDMRTEILILTDGEVWETERLFGFINESSKDGNVRFFSLGVGDAVSHSLVEGISRAGRGYSQIVSTTSNLQKKVMRMLKAALTPHVNDWDIDWAGKPEKQRATLATVALSTVAPISLFDPSCDPDSAPSAPSSSAPNLTLPKVIQAPTVVPALFPYSRATIYFLISNGDRPEKVFLKGTAHDTSSNTICPLQIEIPVQAVTTAGASLGLYQLAGRKLLQDFEEGRLSYLEGIYDEEKEPTKHAELIANEGARVGVEFGLASKWTSFVAVAEDQPVRVGNADQQVGKSAGALAGGEQATSPRYSFCSTPEARSSGPSRGVKAVVKRKSTGGRSRALPQVHSQQQQQMQFRAGPPPPGLASTQSGTLFGAPSPPSPRGLGAGLFGAPASNQSLSFSPSSPESSPSNRAGCSRTRRRSLQLFNPSVPLPDEDPEPPVSAPKRRLRGKAESVPKGPQNLASDLATLQQFNGMFKSDWRIFAWLGLQDRGLEGAHADADLVATMAVIVALETKFPELSEEWEFMVSKAKDVVGRLYSEEDREAVASAVRAALGA
ncbi:hypothetical protein HOY80DRAFT_1022778 [Tuber brumale]|nr:hypothetical protein HOY80DRAFT_1022778 [Tuber brumale]